LIIFSVMTPCVTLNWFTCNFSQ